MARKLFCQLGPTAYRLSLAKQILKRKMRDFFSSERFAAKTAGEDLPVVLYSTTSNMIKRGPGIDEQLQINKAHNIRLASRRMDGLIIAPGQTFSFWHRVGKTSPRNGFKDGRVLVNGRLVAGVGGGLCNLSNSLHLAVMHSPLTITELHHHSDALAPDPDGVRVPYSAGTSVNYNFLDFRFRNDTDHNFQLRVFCEGDNLTVELRSEVEFPYIYRIVEEDHHFSKNENGHYYRNSKIFREIIDPHTGRLLERELKWDNHSRVMFDHSLIPADLIR